MRQAGTRGILVCLLVTGMLAACPAWGQADKAELRQADHLYRQADSLFQQMQDSLALARFRQAREIYVRHRAFTPNLVDACLGMGILYQVQEQFGQAIAAYRESVRYQGHLKPATDSSFFYPYILIASSYIHLNRYDSAYAWYGRAETLLARYPKISQAQRFYNEMGFLFDAFGNYTQSINYFEKALKTLQFDTLAPPQAGEPALIRYVMYNNNIAGSLGKLGYYRQAIARTRRLLRFGLLAPVLHQNIASAFLQVRQPDSALWYLARIPVGDLAAGRGVNPHKALVEYYNSQGLAALQKKDASRALAFYDQARQLSLKHFSASNHRLAQAYAGKGQAYAQQQRYLSALHAYQSAIQALHFNFTEADIYRNPPEAGPGSSPLLLFQVLVHKARAFGRYYRQSRQEKDLLASLFAYQAAFRVSDHIRRGYDSDEAKLFYANTVAPVYEEALSAAFRLFRLSGKQGYLEAAFALAEQSKAAVLAEGLRELEIRRVPGIPAELLRRERDLKRNRAALNQRLAEENEPARRKSLLDELRENEIRLAQTLKAFELNPAYYQLKYDTRAPAARSVVEGLDRKTALLEYVVGKRQLFVFVLSRDGLRARQVPLPAGFKRGWQALYQALYESPAGRRYRGDAAAHRLYQVLVAPLAPWLEGKRRLVIVPDKELCYLPFEALVSKPQTGRYLLQDYTLSYAYSARLQHAALGGDRPVRQAAVLAMAPFVNLDGRADSAGPAPVQAAGLLPLSASAGEVAHTGGRVYLGPEATKARLLQQAGRYDILHLATHARADLRQPLHSFIALYPEPGQAGFRLYVPEIYNLQLGRLRLVVLSACETGGGQLVPGEGIMSLARAFAYAGCPSTVTTLWKAEDQTTAYISNRLYAYLRQGKPKDAALRQAKLDYLESQDNWRRRSPVYWANFIFIGDQAPVYRGSTWHWWLTGGLALAGAAALGWLLHRSRRRQGR